MSQGRAVASGTTFKTGLLPTCMSLAFFPVLVAAIAFGVGASIVGLAMLAISALAIGLFGDSVVRIEEGILEVRMIALRGRMIRLDEIASIDAVATVVNFGQVPALRIEDRQGRRVTICLGWWRREDTLLGYLDDAVRATGAPTNRQAGQLLRRRPPGGYWARLYMRPTRRRHPRPYAVHPRDIAVARVGKASIVLGLFVSGVAVVLGFGVGSFGYVPEVVVGFAALNLGVVAIVLALPPIAWGRPGRPAAAAFLAYAVLITLTVAIIALDQAGMFSLADRRTLRIAVAAGSCSSKPAW